MALDTATVTYSIGDLVGQDFDAARTKIIVTTNIPDGIVVDTEGKSIRVSDGLGTIDANGAGSIEVWTPGTGSNPASWQTYIHLDYVPRAPGSPRKVIDFGPFTVTEDVDLADLIQEQAIPPSYLSEVAGALQGFVDDAEAAATAAQAVGTTNDTVIAGRVGDPTSATSTALTAAYASGVNVEAYGAKGDGVADDTAAWLAAINAVSALGGGTVLGRPDAVYLIGTSSTATAFVVPSGTTSMAVCLIIKAGVTLDLRGGTLKLKAGTNAVLVTNRSACVGGAADTDLGLINAVLDGNNVTLTNKALLQVANFAGLRLDVAVVNVNHNGIQLYKGSRVRSTYMTADTVVGQPFAIGQPQTGFGVTDSTFGLIDARHVTPDPTNLFNFPGNVFYGELQRCTIDTISGRDCSAGIKIAETCDTLSIGKVNLDTVGDSAGNSGLKLQGSSPTACPRRVTVGEVVTKAQAAHGLWIEYATDCSVGSFVGDGNQITNGGPDVWLGGIRTHIGSVKSTNAGYRGVLVRSYAQDMQVGTLVVRNPGTRASNTFDKEAVNVAGGSVEIQSLIAVDDQGSPTMYRGLVVDGITAQVRVRAAKIDGATNAPTNIVANGSSRVDSLATDGTATYVRARLAAEAPALTSGQALGTGMLANSYVWCVPSLGVQAASGFVNETLYLSPWYVPRPTTVSKLGFEVTTAGQSGSTAKAVLYADRGDGAYPGALIATTADTAVDATGVKEVDISATIAAGVYWVGIVVQNAPTTTPALRAPANAMISISRLGVPGVGGADYAYTQASVSGAPPSTFVAPASTAGRTPRIFAKVS